MKKYIFEKKNYQIFFKLQKIFKKKLPQFPTIWQGVKMF
jgi:hypothetical protein